MELTSGRPKLTSCLFFSPLPLFSFDGQADLGPRHNTLILMHGIMGPPREFLLRPGRVYGGEVAVKRHINTSQCGFHAS